MLTQVKAGGYSLRGLSVGGVYTSIEVPELRALFDCGIAPRSLACAHDIFLSHGHADHIGALPSLLGIRNLVGQDPPRIFAPPSVVEALKATMLAINQGLRRSLMAEWVAVEPGDEIELRKGVFVRVFRTLHTVPSVGYQLLRKVSKLKPEYLSLPGAQISRRRKLGEDLFEIQEHLDLAYATDTLIGVIDNCPSLLETRVLILECSFVNDKKSVAESRLRCHIHLDEILDRAHEFKNEALVLMHFSQLASPAEVHRILKERCPPELRQRLVVFAPQRGAWPG